MRRAGVIPGSNLTPIAGGSALQSSNPFDAFIAGSGGLHADSDEFIVDSLASGAWTVRDQTASATLTRANQNISPWSFPAAGTFRSKVVGSYALMQFPKTTNIITITKPLTSPGANMLLWSRFASNALFNNGVSQTQYVRMQFGLYAALGGQPDGNNMCVIDLVNSGAAGRVVASLNVVGGVVTQSNSLVRAAGITPPTMFGVFNQANNKRHLFVGADHGDMQLDATSPYTGSITPFYWGWRVAANNTDVQVGAACPTIVIDFGRRKDDSEAWIV